MLVPDPDQRVASIDDALALLRSAPVAPPGAQIGRRSAWTGTLSDDRRETRDPFTRARGLFSTRTALHFLLADRVETRVQLAVDRIAVLGATGQHADTADGSTLPAESRE